MVRSSFYKGISFSDGAKRSGAAFPALPPVRAARALAAARRLLQPGSDALPLTAAPGKRRRCLYTCIFKQEERSGPAWDQAKAH